MGDRGNSLLGTQKLFKSPPHYPTILPHYITPLYYPTTHLRIPHITPLPTYVSPHITPLPTYVSPHVRLCVLGWYDRDYCEVKNWHQSSKLVKVHRIITMGFTILYAGFETCFAPRHQRYQRC